MQERRAEGIDGRGWNRDFRLGVLLGCQAGTARLVSEAEADRRQIESERPSESRQEAHVGAGSAATIQDHGLPPVAEGIAYPGADERPKAAEPEMVALGVGRRAQEV